MLNVVKKDLIVIKSLIQGHSTVFVLWCEKKSVSISLASTCNNAEHVHVQKNWKVT